MLYPVSLKTVALIVGLLLIVAHLWAYLKTTQAQALLREFPRAKNFGIVLLSFALVWGMWLIYTVDLGEFNGFKTYLYVGVPVLYALSIRYLDDFLAVRALGMLALLAAKPLLEAAYLRPEGSRLFIVVLAYVWIVAGLFWVGMPYILRDQIAWVQQKLLRWQVATVSGAAYGLILVICAFTQYH